VENKRDAGKMGRKVMRVEDRWYWRERMGGERRKKGVVEMYRRGRRKITK
jgi:hypothetical protein